MRCCSLQCKAVMMLPKINISSSSTLEAKVSDGGLFFSVISQVILLVLIEREAWLHHQAYEYTNLFYPVSVCERERGVDTDIPTPFASLERQREKRERERVGERMNGDIENRGGREQHPPPKDGRNGFLAPYYVAETVSESEWTSWLVPMFVVANVAMFIVVMFVNNCPNRQHPAGGSCVASFLGRFSFEPIRENPLFGPSSLTLLKLGSLEWNRVVHQHQGWRLVSSIWLHAGVIHLLANMLSLLFIGIRLEQQFGFIRIGIIYLFSGFGGSILSLLFIQNNISVGASGALFGLLGAMLSELITNWTIYSNKAAALFTLLMIIVINLAIGILPHVDNFAHIGGFLTGILLGFILLRRPQFGWMEQRLPPLYTGRVKSKYTLYQHILLGVSLVLLLVGFVVGLVMLFRGKNGNDSCSWCHYLSCVSTSRWTCGS